MPFLIFGLFYSLVNWGYGAACWEKKVYALDGYVVKGVVVVDSRVNEG